jgi:hypothetical protein
MTAMSDSAEHSHPLAVIRGYDDLHESLRRRADEMHVSRRTIDGLAGIADGLSEKILGPAKTKRLGIISFGAILGALGCKLILVENPEARVMAGVVDDLVEKILDQRCGLGSLGAVMAALGVQLVMVEDPDARATFDRRSPPKRCEYQVRHRGDASHG